MGSLVSSTWPWNLKRRGEGKSKLLTTEGTFDGCSASLEYGALQKKVGVIVDDNSVGWKAATGGIAMVEYCMHVLPLLVTCFLQITGYWDTKNLGVLGYAKGHLETKRLKVRHGRCRRDKRRLNMMNREVDRLQLYMMD